MFAVHIQFYRTAFNGDKRLLVNIGAHIGDRQRASGRYIYTRDREMRVRGIKGG